MVPLYMIRVPSAKSDLLRLYMILDKKGFKSGQTLPRAPESYTEGPFIIFNSVRKSNFCTEILIKLRPLAIARTSLIYA